MKTLRCWRTRRLASAMRCFQYRYTVKAAWIAQQRAQGSDVFQKRDGRRYREGCVRRWLRSTLLHRHHSSERRRSRDQCGWAQSWRAAASDDHVIDRWRGVRAGEDEVTRHLDVWPSPTFIAQTSPWQQPCLSRRPTSVANDDRPRQQPAVHGSPFTSPALRQVLLQPWIGIHADRMLAYYFSVLSCDTHDLMA